MHPAPAARLLQPWLLLPICSLLRSTIAATATNGAGGNTSCSPEICGNLTISYPFSLGGVQPLDCGFPAFELACDASGRAYLNKTFKEHLYRVHSISYGSRSLLVAVEATFTSGGKCPVPDFNVSYGLSLFPLNISERNRDLIFVYDCSVPSSVQLPDKCDNHTMGAYFSDDPERSKIPKDCSSVTTPALESGGMDAQPPRDYKQLIDEGFLLKWPPTEECQACTGRGGECRFVDFSFQCICPDGRPCSQTASRPRDTLAIKIGAGIGAGLVCLILLGAASLLALHKRRKSRKRSASLDGLIREGTPLASLRREFSTTGSPRTHIFTYEELEEATDGFSDARELGVGGFGTVYKGILGDGSVVAVKRIYKNSYKGVEHFLNEVDILSRLRHPNLVTLYGCTSQRGGGSRDRDLLLVYEFVPNGTLADHLHSGRLPWPVRLGIAVETASALDYLHAVEPHQVVHRDVKTNNILLDGGFHVKVADFGLSRLFPADATHVSTAPQGTPGYVDPMYHRCYQLTDKSDVYSFGVVLVELISSKPAVDMVNRAGADVNLANLAVHMIQCHEIDRLVDPTLGYGSTDGGETKTTVDLVAEVAFRCLQPEQDVRPPIREVLDALREGQRMEQAAGRAKVKDADDAGSLKKSRDGSPDSVMLPWISPSTTAHNST